MEQKTSQERRKHERTPPPARAIVHTTQTFGEICDISRGGFSLEYFDTGEAFPRNDHVEILMGGLSLSNVAVSLAWESRGHDPESESLQMSRAGFVFCSLTPLQETILDFFLSNKAAGTA